MFVRLIICLDKILIKMNSFNANSPTIKRLMSEWRNLQYNPEKDFVAGPVGDNLFLWHFTIKGPRDTPFEGGIYHGKIVFPQQYPYSPPDIYFLTPNGRFETGKKICLTITSFHPDQWNPAWDVRTALTSIIAFMPTPAEGAVGAIDMSDADRRKLAKQSHSWHCKECNLSIEPDEIKEKLENESNNENNNTNTENTEDPENNDSGQDINIEEEENVDEAEKEEADNNNDNHQKPEQTEKEVQIDNDEHNSNQNEDDSKNPSTEEQEKEPENAEKHAQTGPYVDEDGISHYNFEELRSVPFESKQSFICILDIPIIILFFLLLFLIANSAFNFVHFFDFD